MTLSMDRRAMMASAAAAGLAATAEISPATAQPSAGKLPAADYYEILDLNGRFCHGLDSGADDGRMFANVFSADGAYVDGGTIVQGAEQLAGMARNAARKGPTNLVHFVINIKVDPAPGGARQYSYVQIVGPTMDGHELVVDGGQYWDDLVKTADGWRIRRRNFLKSGTPRPDPSAIFTANPASAPVRGPADPLTPLDRAQIFQLYSHYAVSFDKVLDEGAAFAALFTPDGVMVDAAGTVTAGRGKLQELAWKKGPIPLKTYFTNLVLEPTGSGVNARAYVMNAVIPPQPAPQIISPVGMCFDQLVKTTEGWRFKRKTLVAPHAPLPSEIAVLFQNPPRRAPLRAGAEPKPAKGKLTAQDYADIQHNYAQYAHGFDSKMGDWYFAVFTEDAEFTDQYDRKSVGRAGLAQSYMNGRPVQPIAFTHSTWNVLIDPAPWGAAGRSYTGGGRANDPTKPPASPGLLGDYVDVLVKTPEGWKFQQRKFFQDFVRTPATANFGPPQQPPQPAPPRP